MPAQAAELVLVLVEVAPRTQATRIRKQATALQVALQVLASVPCLPLWTFAVSVLLASIAVFVSALATWSIRFEPQITLAVPAVHCSWLLAQAMQR